MVTVAPEMPGGWALARELQDRQMRVGLGHSLASFEEVMENFDEGTMHIVHTYNAMGEFSGRNPGLVGVALTRPEFHASLIVDLVHVHPAAVRILWESRHGGQRLFGVSDGSAVLGLPLGEHQIGARRIERRHDRAVLAGTETLVGSVLTMNMAVRNLLAATQCEVWQAVNFVTRNTADYLGLADRLGTIQIGKYADLCVVDSDFEVVATLIGGDVVFGELS
jgi:N-acetylglucosamine-6-phosphate deacetylase